MRAAVEWRDDMPKFEVPKDLMGKIYEAVTLARTGGRIRKGVNETTKSIERGLARLVVIASDVSPEEVVMHLPVLCDEKQVPYAYVESKLELGRAAGIDVPTSSISIESEGEGKKVVSEISAKLKQLNK